ncbi:MAG: hypothetical protein ACRC1H_19550 [Caldilineaceae bacterium]
MSRTRHEWEKAITQRLLAAWDANRTSPPGWRQDFRVVRAQVVASLHNEASFIEDLSWEKFRQLHDVPNPEQESA